MNDDQYRSATLCSRGPVAWSDGSSVPWPALVLNTERKSPHLSGLTSVNTAIKRIDNYALLRRAAMPTKPSPAISNAYVSGSGTAAGSSVKVRL